MFRNKDLHILFYKYLPKIHLYSISHNKSICQWNTVHLYFSGKKFQAWSAPRILHRMHYQKPAFYLEYENIKYNFLFISYALWTKICPNEFRAEKTENKWTERIRELLTSFIISEEQNYDLFYTKNTASLHTIFTSDSSMKF